MMSIWQVLLGNLRRGAKTLRFPERPAVPPGYRGPVQIDVACCVGCGMCAYVCTTGAIQVTDHVTSGEWTYDAGQCTFCGRCADVCPGNALKMETEVAPAYNQPGAMHKVHPLIYPPCPECGRPSPPINDAVLARLLGNTNEEPWALGRLCSRCRRRHYQRALVHTLVGDASNKEQSS